MRPRFDALSATLSVAISHLRGRKAIDRAVPANPDIPSRLRLRESTDSPDLHELLGRKTVNLDTPELQRFIAGKTVLVTGAGGSIGSEICRQAMRFCPGRLVLLDRAENALFEIDRELRDRWVGANIVPMIADICDANRVAHIFRAHQPQVVFHCAAHKHVPMMEHNPGEAIKNNVFGTKIVADAAVEFSVQAFVMVSTDKAVNPTSVMGASKRVAEMYVQSLSVGGEGLVWVQGSGFRGEEGSGFRGEKGPGFRVQDSVKSSNRNPEPRTLNPSTNPEPRTANSSTTPEPRNLNPAPSHTLNPSHSTRFVAVRFGNVLGSSGSVIPIFRKQIEAGGPVTVTHPEMRRYFMTIPEASQLVMQAGAIGQGGEIFVLDMGQPIKILDLAKEMIRRSGLVVDEDIHIRITGIRPGEKLYEELACDNEQTRPTAHEKIRVWQLATASPQRVKRMLDVLAAVTHGKREEVLTALSQCVPEFQPESMRLPKKTPELPKVQTVAA